MNSGFGCGYGYGYGYGSVYGPDYGNVGSSTIGNQWKTLNNNTQHCGVGKIVVERSPNFMCSPNERGKAAF